jgi:hypothetical protein
VTTAKALIEPETAMTVPVPLPTEVTSPADETVAMPVAVETHVTGAPGMALPPASLTVAVSVAVSAIDAKESEVGDNSMLERTCSTVTADVAVNDPEVAVTVAVPSATEVTSPADETVATDAADVVQVTGAPGMTVPPASLTVAVSVAVSATETKVSEDALSSMVDATWLTMTDAVALPSPEVAVIVAVPSATAVTSPVDETVATPSSDEDHVTSAPGTPTPPRVTVAVSCFSSER